jgi:hypothetical protein
MFIRQKIFFLGIKSRRIVWAAHVSRMGERREEYRVVVGNYRGKGTDVESTLRYKIILKSLFKNMKTEH